MPNLTIPLLARKTPELLGHLTYQPIALANTQKRLAGRYALQPDIDLDSFRARSVIDWIKIGVRLDRATQFQWLQKHLEPILGHTPYVENIAGKPNESSDDFEITFQEPDIALVRKALKAIKDEYGLRMDPVVRSIEISVDFYPKAISDIERAKMVRVLTNHLLVEPDMISNLRDRPRTVWGKSKSTQRLIPGADHFSEGVNKQLLIDTEWDHAPFTDATFMLGAKEAEVRWRVMDKVIDTQNKTAGTYVQLDDTSKRARIEVTLAQEEMNALGITYLKDLEQFDFKALQKRYFRFFLPTFSGPIKDKSEWGEAISNSRDLQRQQKFLKAGNIGLKAMDDARDEKRIELRRQSLPDMHERGLRVSPMERTGKGTAGTFVAYEELNLRVQTALRNLGKRVVKVFSVGS